MENLTALRNPQGKIMFISECCKLPPQSAFGAANKDQLVHMLVCPKCQRIVGEWITLEERDGELKKFAERAATMFAL